MAKTFNELKEGDTLYWLSIHMMNTDTRKGNCATAYKKLKKEISIDEYPTMSTVGEFKVLKVEEPLITHFGKPAKGHKTIVVYYNYEGHQSISDFDRTNTTEVKNFLIDSYHIYSTSKDELIVKGREIVQALIEVNRNNMIERDKCYKEMLLKLNNCL